MTYEEKLNMNIANIETALDDYGRYTRDDDVLEDVSREFILRVAKDNLDAKDGLRNLFRKSPVWNEELDAIVINGNRTHDPNYARIDCLANDILKPWAFDDFDKKSDIRKAIESGEDFDTGWFGCKKEIRDARVHHEHGEFEVEVTAYMDDLWDEGSLIYDALWTVAKSGEELPEDIIDSIRDAAIDSGVDDHTYCNRYLPLDASYETVVNTISELEDEAEQTNEELYRILCGIVEDHVKFMKEREAKEDQE